MIDHCQNDTLGRHAQFAAVLLPAASRLFGSR